MLLIIYRYRIAFFLTEKTEIFGAIDYKVHPYNTRRNNVLQLSPLWISLILSQKTYEAYYVAVIVSTWPLGQHTCPFQNTNSALASSLFPLPPFFCYLVATPSKFLRSIFSFLVIYPIFSLFSFFPSFLPPLLLRFLYSSFPCVRRRH